jgi:anaerobic magnesium-protoporphyrin IX monomethyl ester cyclase
MNIALIDYNHPVKGFANRDMTGGFGSGMYARGVIGTFIKKIKKSNIRIPILTFAYLNAIARSLGNKVSIYTGMPMGEELIIIASSIHHYKEEVYFAKEIKKHHPNSKIGFIGPFSSEKPSLYIDSCDFIIDGEPETIFEDICKDKIKLEGVIKTSNNLEVKNLPLPNWDGFDIMSFGYSPSLPRKPFLTIQGSRGCPFACEFCPYLVSQGIPLRRRENNDIINEIKYLIKKYKIKSLLFRDITWSMHRKETKELCKLIEKQNFDLDIGVETRADTLDDELIILMKKAGVKVVNLGIESPEDNILLNAGRRPIKEIKLENVLKKLDHNNILVQGFYIIGLIDDTKETIENTIRYSKKINSFTAQFCVLTPFPGTKTYKDLEHKLITDDFSKFTEYEPVVNIKGVDEHQIRRYLDKAYSTYYIRPSWILKHGFRAIKSFLQ